MAARRYKISLQVLEGKDALNVPSAYTFHSSDPFVVQWLLRSLKRMKMFKGLLKYSKLKVSNASYKEDILWPRGDTKFPFKC